MQGGLHAAACIRRELAGKRRRTYRYHDLGSAAYISRGQALLQVGPVRISGFLGWLAWGFLHIAFLTGVRNRVSTVVTWLATIARASRYHRAFMLGAAATPERGTPGRRTTRPSNNCRPAKADERSRECRAERTRAYLETRCAGMMDGRVATTRCRKYVDVVTNGPPFGVCVQP